MTTLVGLRPSVLAAYVIALYTGQSLGQLLLNLSDTAANRPR